MLMLVPFALLAAAPDTLVPAAAANDTAVIVEWTVPWEQSRPRDPYVDAQDRVWFVGQRGNYIAYFDQKTQQFKRFEIDPGTHPHNLIVDRQGMVWYAGNRNGMIGKLDPASGKITRYPMPDSAARDPHTLIFDKNGDIWFTVQGGGYVGKLTTKTGDVRLIKVTGAAGRRGPLPYGIVIDSKNRPWFDEFGTNKIGTVDPATMQLKEYTLPDPSARPRRIAVTSDDMVWYVDYARGYLGRLDPRTGEVQEWANPSGNGALPYAMAADDHDRIWFVESGPRPNKLVGFDPKTQKFFSVTAIPGGADANTVRHMFFHKPTGSLWFGTDRNTLGRAMLPGYGPQTKTATND